MLSVTVVNKTRTEVENPLSFVFEIELVCYFLFCFIFPVPFCVISWDFYVLCFLKISIMLYSVDFKDKYAILDLELKCS